MKMIRWLFWPFSLIYATIMFARNKLFDWQILKSHTPPVFSIGVGNLSAGGTGKTPTIAYLLETFKGQKIAVLSRGYGRKTKGYFQVSESESTSSVGDEIKMLFDQYHHLASFHVCENRVEGTKKILERFPDTKLLLFDDVYQHRYIKPHVLLLLSSAGEPYFNDYILPTGNLREGRSGAKRADAVVITKLSEKEDRMALKSQIKMQRPLYFAEEILSLAENINGDVLPVNSKVFAFSGLAKNDVFANALRKHYQIHGFKNFKDHHQYQKSEILEMMSAYTPLVTTAKDYVKIKELLNENELSNVFVANQKVQIESQNGHSLGDWLKSLFNNFQSSHGLQS